MLEYEGFASAELFGYYIGEVLMKHRQGRWQPDPDAAARKVRRFRLHFDDGTIADPAARVERFAQSGEGAGALASYVRTQLEPVKR